MRFPDFLAQKGYNVVTIRICRRNRSERLIEDQPVIGFQRPSLGFRGLYLIACDFSHRLIPSNPSAPPALLTMTG